MRPALRRFLAIPSALSDLRHALAEPSVWPLHNRREYNVGSGRNQKSESAGQEAQVRWTTLWPDMQDKIDGSQIPSQRDFSVTAKARSSPRFHESRHRVSSERNASPRLRKIGANELVSRQVKSSGAVSKDALEAPGSTAQAQHGEREFMTKREKWRARLSTFEQFQFESDVGTPAIDRPRLIDNDSYAEDWLLWLELIRFRRRHVGVWGMQVIYKEIFRQGRCIPTHGGVGKELWILLLQVGQKDSTFLRKVIDYATQIKRSTGIAAPRLYECVVGQALKENPDSAPKWHSLLKQDFTPSIDDYRILFKLSASWGSITHLRALYKDYPLVGMYATVIPKLCNLQMYEEAIKWHTLLFAYKDIPLKFDDIKPLLAYCAHAGDSARVEQLVKDLNMSQSSIINQATKYVRKNEIISRELVNRQLGEVHGVAPKQPSDSFCARLFATRLFAVKTIINGLQMMALDKIGPLSLREIVLRDDCHPPAVLRHLDDLKHAGISLDASTFTVVLQNLARADDHTLLKNLVQSDLHPDTLEDLNLQEKLLAQYYAADDHLQVKRTLAILTAHCSSQKERSRLWWNLVFRSHVTLRRGVAVKSIMETMRQSRISITSRSSRHMRVLWLTKRHRGHGAQRTAELSIIIRATQNTLESGGFVPIIAWRELMRRLGMAGRLLEFENMALWLADYYSSPAGQQSMPADMLLQSGGKQSCVEADNPARYHNPQKYLNVLFTRDAQHAIVAWGFQQEVRMNPESSHARKTFKRLGTGSSVSTSRAPFWTWGLLLLRKLQERGVPIQQATVSRICRQRLIALFGHGTSKRPINRRVKWINEIRAGSFAHYMPMNYVREMEGIWGQDLFRHQIQWTSGFRHRRLKSSDYWSKKIEQGFHRLDRRSLIHREQRSLCKRKQERLISQAETHGAIESQEPPVVSEPRNF